MRISIFLLVISSIISFVKCGSDNKVSAEYTEKRVIWNHSDYDIHINMYYVTEELDSEILAGNSLTLSAHCKVRGGDKACFNPDYSSAFSSGFEDSLYVVFNNEKILRYRRENIDSCCTRNILKREAQWGYNVTGEDTAIRTYTYEITNEDYDNADPIEG